MTVHPHDEIEAFALGSLQPDEAAAVLAHADTCPSCAVLLAEAMGGIAALTELEAPSAPAKGAPRPGVTVASLASARSQRILRLSPATWVASVAAAACLALLVWNIELQRSVPVVPIASLVNSHFVHHELRGAGGSAKVLQAVDGHWVYVVGDRLTPNAKYTLWEVRNGVPAVLGPVRADGAGRATAYFEQTAGKIDAFDLTSAGKDIAQDTNALRWP